MGRRKGTKENETAREQRGHMAVRPRQHAHANLTTGRGGHHGQTVVVVVPGVSPASRTLRCVLVLVRMLCLCWVILGFFCYLL